MKKLSSIIGPVINRGLALLGFQIKRPDSGFWDLDPEFIQVYKNVEPKTLVKIDRSYMIYQFAKSSSMLPSGDVAQVGIYKGGTAKMVAQCFMNSNKKIYLFDTFDGLPPVSENDGVKNNQNKGNKYFSDVNFDEVKALLSGFSRIEFKKGFFPDTAKGLEDSRFCFAYLDADLYQSTKDGLSFFYPRMVPGGIIMIDDYGTSNWPGVERAVSEFCEENNLSPIKTAWWQGMVIKGM